MTTLFTIISIYIAINLAMLVFKPVRKSWRIHIPFYKEMLLAYKDLYTPNLKWWEWPLAILFCVLVEPLVLLLVVLFVIIPIPTYIRAAFFVKHPDFDSITNTRIIPPPEQWGANTNQNRICFDRNMPFTPDFQDVIYVENEYNPKVHDYINEHFDELQQQYKKWGNNLIFLPSLNNKEVSNETLRYMFPYLPPEVSFTNNAITVGALKQHIIDGAVEGPALIHFIITDDENPPFYEFSYCPLVPDSMVPLGHQFEWHIRSLFNDDNRARYMVALPHGDDVADWCFNDGDADSSNECALHLKADDLKLVGEIRERINELRKRGIQLGLLQDLIEEQPTLSRLVVDKDFRIFLPDYNNVEIMMSPLPKAVYLLFLKHPEGILFKHLHDYYSELLDIYKQISNRVVEKNILRSIQDITDPTKNSINEKCTRIREAFLKQFDYVYAQHYFITGKRGEPKKITLPRELVDLQAL